jgi:hypothetical protein
MPRGRRHQDDHDRRRGCGHVAVARLVEPYSAGCQECVDRGDGWVDLRLRLSCGPSDAPATVCHRPGVPTTGRGHQVPDGMGAVPANG